MTKDELMEMARGAEIDFEEGESLSGEVMMFTEFRPSIKRMSAFANAILERAAEECDRLKLMYTNMAENEDENFSTSELTSRYWGNVSALSGAGYDIRALKIKERE